MRDIQADGGELGRFDILAAVTRLVTAGAARVRPGVQFGRHLTVDDIVSLMLHYGTAYARGFIRRAPLRSSGAFMCERHVELRGHRRITIGRGTLLERGSGLYANAGRIEIGTNVVIGRFSIIEASSGVRDAGGTVQIGSGTALGDYCYLGGAGGLRIGSNVLVGQSVSFHSENHRFDEGRTIKSQGVEHQGIRVGDDCWIGAGARVLDGVALGTGCVIGAGAIVTRSVEAGSVVVGVPGRVTRRRWSKE